MSTSASAAMFRPRACARCRESKLRCNWVSDPGKEPCERCTRIRAECVLPALTARAPRRVKTTRVHQLEMKIDGIVSLLTAANATAGLTPAPETPKPTTSQPASSPDVEYTHTESRLAPSAELPTFDKPTSSDLPPLMLPRAPPLEHIEVVPGLRITYYEADQALYEYRTTYSPYFPFAPLAPDVTAYDLFQSRPLLFRTIMLAVLPQSFQDQRSGDMWFREYVAEHIVVRQEKRLEIVQALLVFIGWSDGGYYIECSMTSLYQLLAGLVSDLGLNKPPMGKQDLHTPSSLVAEAALALKGRKAKEAHTKEELRAALGCFFVTSTQTNLFRRVYPRPYAQYLMQCCDTLAAAREYESDVFLVYSVRMMHLMSRIDAAMPNVEVDGDGPRYFPAPLLMTMATLRKEMDVLVHSQLTGIQNDALQLLAYRCAVMRIYEPIIYMRSSHDPDEAARRTEGLWSCLTTCGSLLETYLSIPVEQLGALPFSFLAQMSFGLITTSRLLFLERDADWDVHLARRTIDFATVTQRLEDRFQAADMHEARLESRRGLGRRRKRATADKSLLASYGLKMGWIREWYIRRTTGSVGSQGPRDSGHGAAIATTTTTTTTTTSAALAADATADIDSGFTGSPVDFDGAFWQALLNFDGSVDFDSLVG